jgi:hypothetical protein
MVEIQRCLRGQLFRSGFWIDCLAVFIKLYGLEFEVWGLGFENARIIV